MIQALYRLNPWKTDGEVLIIGGGPIGLFTAAQIKALRPNTDVHIYEKYHSYQRRHIVQIRHSCLKGAPDHPIIQSALEKIKGTKPRGWIWKTSMISTSELEEILANAAETLGVKIHRGCFIQKPQDLAKFHNNTRFILGADGAHSATRKAIFGDELQTKQKLTSIAELKYFIRGETTRISPKQLYVGCKKVGEVITEHVGKMNASGKTPITVRMVISDKDHEKMQNATFKNPFKIDQCPEKIRIAFENWKQRRKRLKEDQIVPDSEKVSAVALSNYASKRFVKCLEEVQYALFGDSTVGVPFFSSLNFGLRCSIEGSKRIVQSLENPESTSLRAYERFVQKNAKWELTYAKIKSFALKCFGFIVWFNQLFPWQFIKDNTED